MTCDFTGFCGIRQFAGAKDTDAAVGADEIGQGERIPVLVGIQGVADLRVGSVGRACVRSWTNIWRWEWSISGASIRRRAKARRYTATGFERVIEPELTVAGTEIRVNVAEVFSALDP